MSGNVESVESIPDPSTKPKTKRVSLSELTTYRSCRRKWFLSYYLKLKKREKSGALALGTNVHEALAHYYSGGTVQSSMEFFADIYANLRYSATEYEIDAIEKDYALGSVMLEGYFQWAEETGVDQHLEESNQK